MGCRGLGDWVEGLGAWGSGCRISILGFGRRARSSTIMCRDFFRPGLGSCEVSGFR